MKTLNKWIRIIHRWLVVPFAAVVALALVDTVVNRPSPQLLGWIAAIAVGSLLLLLLSGLYMFAQHYLAKWQRSRRKAFYANLKTGFGEERRESEI